MTAQSMELFNKLTISQLKAKAHQIRKNLIEVTIQNGAGHIAPSLSSIDILTALYYRVMNIARDPEWEGRDRLVFSKAHGCYGVYAILVDMGYLEKEKWETFYTGSSLPGCIEMDVEHGIEAGCGSLGHGLPMAAGIAFGARLQGKKYRVYCIVGDGELQEGSNWEAIQFAVKHELSNLTIVIDHNGLQAMDFLHNIMTPRDRKNDIQRKMRAFGCIVRICNGHNMNSIVSVLEAWRRNEQTLGAPQALVAKTVKGYGLLCIENVAKFHFRLPTEEEINMGKRYE
jgi:transketolase